MTEDDARTWVAQRFGAAAVDRLQAFADLLLVEASAQSLIARSTFDAVWVRHIVDSAQLIDLAPVDGAWLDVGSGGGLPGVVVAILRDAPVVMVEPRRKRAAFLAGATERLRLRNTRVIQANVQKNSVEAAVVSARAVGSISDLFLWTRSSVSRETLYLLPRGENASSDVELTQRTWQGAFHVKQSITDHKAGIVIAQGVTQR